MFQPRCVVGVFFSSFEQKGKCLFVLSDLDPLNCRRSHVGETPDRGITANSAIQIDRPNATGRDTCKRGPTRKLDNAPESRHLRSGSIDNYRISSILLLFVTAIIPQKVREDGVTFRHFQIPSTRSSKLRNEVLPDVGYFQYYVCTPTQIKLTLAGCLFPRETNYLLVCRSKPKFCCEWGISGYWLKELSFEQAIIYH